MALAASGGINIYGEFPSDSRTAFIEGLTFFLLEAGWEMTEEVHSSVSATIGSNPANNSTKTIAGVVYTFKTAINNAIARQVLIGATAADSYNNLAHAINRDIGAGTNYSTKTTLHPTCQASFANPVISIRYTQAGPYGNGVTTDFGTLLNGGWKVTGASWQLGATSGDYLKVTAYIFDSQGTVFDGALGFLPMVLVQLISARDTSRVSTAAAIVIKPGHRHRVVANRCQFFCFVPGVDIDSVPGDGVNKGTSVSAGIPWVPSSTTQVEQSGNVPAASCDEAWWISCDQGPGASMRTAMAPTKRIMQIAPDSSGTGSLTTFSRNYRVGSLGDGCWNTTVSVGQFGPVSLLANKLTSAEPGLDNCVCWHNDIGLKIEPLIAWPTIANGTVLIRGQLYDAWIKSAQANMDDTEDQATMGVESLVTDPTYFWLAFTDRYKYGTLWLLVPPLVQLESFQSSWVH